MEDRIRKSELPVSFHKEGGRTFLARNGIYTIEQLTLLTIQDLEALVGIGESRTKVILKALDGLGIKLKSSITDLEKEYMLSIITKMDLSEIIELQTNIDSVVVKRYTDIEDKLTKYSKIDEYIRSLNID